MQYQPTKPIKAKVQMKRGKHMGNPGKPVTIQPNYHPSKPVKVTKVPR